MDLDGAPFSPADAAAQITAVHQQLEVDRAQFDVVAFPLALFGVISLVASVIAATAPITTYATFWAFAGPIGGVTIGLWSWTTEQRWPFERPHTLAVVTTAFALVASVAVASTGGSAATPFFGVGTAYVLFSAFTGSKATFHAALAIIAVTWASWLGLRPLDDVAVLTAAVGLVQLTAATREVRSGRARVAAARLHAQR